MESQNTNDSELSSSQPKLINIPLFLHQLKSVEKMTTSENTQIIETGGLNYINTKLGVLADLPGYGKCLKRDTPIVLYSGEIEFVQNIKVGTLLMGDDSTPRTVLSISSGIGEMFKIKQKDGGEDYTVNSEHILSMKMSVSKFIKKSNMGVQAFFFVPEKVDWNSKDFSYANYSSKEEANEKAQCFLNDLVINPYIDIELSKYMNLSKDLKSKLLGYRVGVEFQEKKVDIDPYFMGLLMISKDTIPFDYKVNSRSNRLKLLEGLIDSNKVFQKNNMMANDIVFLCRSLGFRTIVENGIISYSHKDLCCEIEIEPVGIDNYYGFTLDGNHRYLHGDFTVSHNSLSLLGLIANSQSVLNENEERTVYSEDIKYFKYVSEVLVSPLEHTKCSLILVNVSLLSQWILELNRTLLKYKAVYNKNDIENISLNDYDVIVVANNVYNLFSQVYRKKSWKRFAIDEPMSLKFHTAMEPINAEFYWLITATPIELYMKRRTGFLAELLPEDLNVFNHLIHKNDDAFVKSSYQMPHTFFIKHQCSGNMAKLFDGLLNTNVTEMIEAGCFDGVFDYLKAPEDEKTIIGAFRHRKLKRIDDLQKESSSVSTIEKIQNIEKHLNILEERISSHIYLNPCIICDSDYRGNNAFITSCCQNIFCGCELHGGKCPVCKSVDVCSIGLLNYKVMEPLEQICKKNSKPETVLEIIGDSNGKKVLIFSNYNESFTILKKFLDEKQLSYLELKGTKEKRDNTIDLYKTGNINILLLDTILSGAGLNLQETTDIILYHEVKQYQEIQILGRAVRIGRIVPLNVHRLE